MSIARNHADYGLSVDSSTEDGRAAHRKNLFVSAVLCSDDGINSAVIRNLSESGALIEGTVLPRQGTQIRLRRGSLEVAGVVVWQNGCRAGLKFKQAIAVDKWLPTAKQAHQTLVDEMISEIRDVRKQSISLKERIETSDINSCSIAKMIEDVLDKLSDDIRIVSDHSDSLQLLEIAVRHLRQNQGDGSSRGK